MKETLAALLTELETEFEGMKNMLGLYTKYWLPLGEVLTDMEREGIFIDVDHLKTMKIKAEEDKKIATDKFLSWVKIVCKEADQFNPNST